jgi:hypothetical protein
MKVQYNWGVEEHESVVLVDIDRRVFGCAIIEVYRVFFGF